MDNTVFLQEGSRVGYIFNPQSQEWQVAYAEHQKAMWQAMGEEACAQFVRIWPDSQSWLHSIL